MSSIDQSVPLSVIPKHGAFAQGDGAVSWSVWAPLATRVDLVLVDGESCEIIPLQAESRGWFSHIQEGCAGGQRYGYRLNNGPTLPDPASRWQPDGVQQTSAVFLPGEFSWSDDEWRGLARSDLVFYELHVGTFTPEGTFAAIVPRLSELRDLGITAIELMPVAQYSGTRNWGYDGVFPFAVQTTYGGPREFQRFVDACHRHGMSVFLDVVYNHLGPEGNYFSQYGPYFSTRYHTPWGAAFNYDDKGCDAVRAFVLDNVRYWLREFHCDGLRLDSVHAIFDNSPRHILREIQAVANEVAHFSNRSVYIIAESNLNDVRLLEPWQRGGYELAAQWNDDFHHSVHTLLTGEQAGYYCDFGKPEHLVKAVNETFVYDGCYSEFRGRRHGAPLDRQTGDRFVISIQNHDQVGNRALGERFGTLLSPEQQNLASGLLLLSPFLPLIFMGEEYGETQPFPFFCSFHDAHLIAAVREGRRAEFAGFPWPDSLPDPQAVATFESAQLTWKWPIGTWHDSLRRWYRDLLTLRRCHPAMRNFEQRQAIWHPDPRNELQGVLELRRGNENEQPTRLLAAYFNLSAEPQPQPLPEWGVGQRDLGRGWKLVLSSTMADYNTIASPLPSVQSANEVAPLAPYAVRVFANVNGSESK